MLPAILALAIFAVPFSGPVQIDAYALPGEDLADSIARLQHDPSCARDQAGCKVQLGCLKTYRTKPIKLCRAMQLIGCGGWGHGASTIIEAAENVGVYVAPHTQCTEYVASHPHRRGGGWSVLSDFAVKGTRTNTSTPTYGIVVESRAHLERLYVTQFAQGIRISADVHRPEASNANLWSLHLVRVDYTYHAGIYTDGGDANAGLAMLPDVMYACRRASDFPQLGPCAGIVASDFLGSTWIATHVADSSKAVHADGLNARHTFVGAYAEGGQSDSFFESQGALVLGGIGGWAGPRGVRIADERINRIRFFSAAPSMELRLGDFGSAGSVLELAGWTAPFVPGWALRLKGQNGYFLFDVANSASHQVLKIKGFQPGLGSVTFPLGGQ